MINLFARLLVLVCVMHCIAQQQDETLWNEAQQLYIVGDYVHALTPLLKINNHNAALYMILSNCYEKIDNSVQAHVYQQKAFIYGSCDQKKKILKERYQKENNTFDYPIMQLIKDVTYSISLLLHMFFLQIIFLLLLFFLFFYAKRFGTQLFLILLCVIVGMCIKNKSDLEKPRAITAIHSVIRSFAKQDAPVIIEIEKDALIYCFEKKDGFYKIEGKWGRGWISEDDIIRII